jgi:hypothetical protein
MDFYKGQQVKVDDTFGIITAVGSKHLSVTFANGECDDVPYSAIKTASIPKQAQRVIKEEEAEGNHFLLVKEEVNKDGEMSITYKITVNDKDIWTSEEIIINVYDHESGWSAPDDFDENKLDLIQSNAEAGFDLLVDSYQTIQDTIQESLPSAQEPAKPKDVPAFAPGEGSTKTPKGEGTPLPEGAVIPGGASAEPKIEPEDDSKESTDTKNPEEGAEFGESGEDTTPESTAASIQPFTRKIAERAAKVKKGEKDNRLHGNPQYRLNPILRAEMERRKIPSGDTHDIELAEKLKHFDWGSLPKKALKRLEHKIAILEEK